MERRTPLPAAFVIRDCALSGIATGRRARDLRELRDHLREVHPGVLYYHLWGGLLRPRFDDPEYNNDFASWTRHALRDNALAERLALIDPAKFPDMDALRGEILETIEERLDEIDFPQFSSRDSQFHLVRAQLVIFDTGRRVTSPDELGSEIGRMSLGSVFYHVIDARRRLAGGCDDFSEWLGGYGDLYRGVRERLAGLDPYFLSLHEIRDQIVQLLCPVAEGEAQ